MSEEYTPLQDPEALAKALSVTKLDVQPGEVLHVRVGISAQDMDGSHAWIPGPDELDYVRSLFERIVPEDALLLVTHRGIELSSHEAPSQAEMASIDEEAKLYGGTD